MVFLSDFAQSRRRSTVDVVRLAYPRGTDRGIFDDIFGFSNVFIVILRAWLCIIIYWESLISTICVPITQKCLEILWQSSYKKGIVHLSLF